MPCLDFATPPQLPPVHMPLRQLKLSMSKKGQGGVSSSINTSVCPWILESGCTCQLLVCASVCMCTVVCSLPHSHLAMCYSVPGQAFPTDPFVLNSSAVALLCQVVCLLQLCKMCECVCESESESERERERVRACVCVHEIMHAGE